MATPTYDPLKIVGTLAGINIIGYMSGTMVKASRAEKTWEVVVGGQGDAARVRKRNKSGTVVVTLMQTSPTNDEFSQLLADDERDASGSGDLSFVDTNGTTVIEAETAWLEGYAEVTFGDGLEGREWTIATGVLELVVGGAL